MATSSCGVCRECFPRPPQTWIPSSFDSGRPVLEDQRDIPAWVDEALRRAVHPDPQKRYQELSEFLYDLRHPNKAYLHRGRTPLVERNPVLFWKGVSLTLGLLLLFMTGLVVVGGR